MRGKILFFRPQGLEGIHCIEISTVHIRGYIWAVRTVPLQDVPIEH